MINVFDLHNDFLTEIKTYDKQAKYIKSARAQGLLNVCSSVWTTRMGTREALGAIERAQYFAKNNNVKFAVEDLGFAETLEDAEHVAELKPAYVGLTWNDENKFAGGAKSYAGLSEMGASAVRILEENGVQVDTAHLNEKSFLDFCNVTSRPILCSHTACGYLRGHDRNFKDYQFKIVAETGGLVGIAFVPDFLTEEKKCTVSDIVRHIDYFVQKFGMRHIALGTDFYGTKIYPKGISSYKNLSKVQIELLKLGYTESSIEKIFYKNALNFFENNFASHLENEL